MLRELRLGKKIKKLPPNKTLLVEERIHNVVSKWQEHVDEDREVDYLKTIGYHLHM